MSTITADIGERTLSKITWRIIPFVFCLYFIAFLDRVNLSYAALTMNKELGFNSTAFGFVAGIFFLGYFLFEVPSNLMLHRFGARKWIARIMVTWGFIVIITAWVQNETQLCGLRFLLGAGEAGFFPGIVYYFSFWFPAKQQAKSLATFMVGIAISNFIGAPLSTWIMDNIQWAGLSGWRWLFILEGLPAIIMGIATFFFLTDRPDDARWLAQEEKDWLKNELQKEQAEKNIQHLSIWQVMANKRVWHLIITPLACMTGMYGLILWLPQLIKGLSSAYTNTQVGIISMIPYFVGAIVMVVVARHSDRTGERPYHIACCLAIAAVALVGSTISANPVLSIAMLSIASAALYSYHGPFWSLPSMFLEGESRAVGIAFINSFGQLGGFLGPMILGYLTSLTGTTTGGLYIIAGCLIVGAISTALLKGNEIKG
jgi:MFS transporter, ACS family, tartrate transporter